MSEGHKDAAMSHLKQFILLAIILWIVWYIGIGPDKPSAEDPYIEPGSQIDNPGFYTP